MYRCENHKSGRPVNNSACQSKVRSPALVSTALTHLFAQKEVILTNWASASFWNSSS